jgi:hypothetical protein
VHEVRVTFHGAPAFGSNGRAGRHVALAALCGWRVLDWLRMYVRLLDGQPVVTTWRATASFLTSKVP